VDYRKLNSVTIQDAYPLPRIDESLDAVAGSKFFQYTGPAKRVLAGAPES